MRDDHLDRKRIEELFLAALERDPAERAAFLDGACWGDAQTRELVEELLRHSDKDDDFLAEPALGGSFDIGAFVEDAGSSGDELRPPSAEEIASGRSIGDYVIREELGHGMQGFVYLAHDTRLDRDVAIKLMPETLSFSRHARQRFAREATAASRLDHPGICTVFEIGEDGGIPYIVMPFVKGKTLQRKIEEAKEESRSTESATCVDIDSSEDLASEAHLTGTGRVAQLVRFGEETELALHAAH